MMLCAAEPIGAHGNKMIGQSNYLFIFIFLFRQPPHSLVIIIEVHSEIKMYRCDNRYTPTVKQTLTFEAALCLIALLRNFLVFKSLMKGAGDYDFGSFTEAHNA